MHPLSKLVSDSKLRFKTPDEQHLLMRPASECTPILSDFRGPIDKRGCTDVLCLLLLLAFLGGWIFVAYMAFQHGNPEVLIYPSNSNGQVRNVGIEVRIEFC